MSAPPIITVLLSVYNGERFLEAAVRSVLAQTFPSFEFIVVDDGSTDRSAGIVRAFADPRIRLLQNGENRGLTASLNRGLAEARGEFVARLDADDIAEPSRLERQLRYLNANPSVALVGSGCRIIDAEGRVLRTERQPGSHAVLRWAMVFRCPFYHSAVMWRRAVVAERVGAFDPSFHYAMDYDLWIRTARVLPVANLASPLVRYRVGPHAMTAQHAARVPEIRRARFSAAHALFADGNSERERWDRDADRIFQVVDGWRSDAGPGEVVEVIDTIQALCEAYIARVVADPGAASPVRAWTRECLARMLLRGALEAHHSGAPARRDACFRTALRLRPAALGSIAAARYAAARLGRAPS